MAGNQCGVGRAHHDSSLSGRLLGGAEPFKLATEAAKLALEQHYLDSNQERLQQVIPATCVMSSATVPTWPKHHQPTSDGGGRKGVKQGRINHFRHQEISAAERNQEAERAETISNEGITNVLSARSTGSLEWLGISREEWRKLRSIRVPVRELHYLFMCLVILLETPIEQRDAPTALRAIFQEPTFTESAFVRIAGGAGTKIFAWLQKLLDEYDERDLGLLRIDIASDVASQEASPASDEAKDDREQQQEQNGHEQAEEKTSPVLRALQNVTKSPKSPSRRPIKIVDPGRLFGRHHATQ
ncbi:hypothetical protein GQ600_22908 [Phytophthora cactorum]|nr:hypothetical protein GQ600_22908 [Phytophthora cactorum]